MLMLHYSESVQLSDLAPIKNVAGVITSYSKHFSIHIFAPNFSVINKPVNPAPLKDGFT